MKSTYLGKHYSAAIKGNQIKSLNIVKKKTIINYNGILSMLKWWEWPYKRTGHRDCMVVGFITTYAISAYHHLSCEFESHSGEVYSLQLKSS